MPKCKSCNAEIQWAKTPAGKPMPVNMTAAENGNVALLQSPKGPIAVVLDSSGKAPHESLQPSPDAPKYLSHFVTCPAAGLHRRTK